MGFNMKATQKDGYVEFYDKDSTETLLEDSVQIFASDYVKYNYPEMVFFHVVNENKKTIGQARKDKAKGLLKGVSDCVFMIPEKYRANYSFGAIELKRATKKLASPVSEDQKAFLKSVRESGGFGAVAYGREGFLAAFKEMISK